MSIARKNNSLLLFLLKEELINSEMREELDFARTKKPIHRLSDFYFNILPWTLKINREHKTTEILTLTVRYNSMF